MKYHHNQKMKVVKNFYRGKIGYIKDYEMQDDDVYYILEVEIDDKKENIRCSESEIKPTLF